MMNFFDEPGPQLGSPFESLHIGLVMRALEFVWQQLPTATLYQHTPFQTAHYANEDEINSRLVELLNRLLKHHNAPWFSPGMFQNISRDAKSASILHGTEKMPDMTVCLVEGGRYCPRDNALLVECKVIRSGHGTQTVKNYVDKGMMRFIDKRYSAFATQAMMVAYTAPAFAPVPALTSYFAGLPAGDPHVVCDSLSTFVSVGTLGAPKHSQACRSEHDRGDPLNLIITHLWLYH